MKQFLKRLMIGVISLAMLCCVTPMAFAATPGFYTVYLEPQGGTGAGTQIYAFKSGGNYRVSSLPTLTMDGYTFDGWYDSDVGGTKISTDYNFKEDGQTIYAHWSAKGVFANTDTSSDTETKPTLPISLKGHFGTILIVGTTVAVVTMVMMNN